VEIMSSMGWSSSDYQPRRFSADPEPVRDNRSDELEYRLSPTPSGSASFNPDLKTIVELGGGLGKTYITKVIPPEVLSNGDGTLRGVLDYMVEQAPLEGHERGIKDMVGERLGMNDHRVIYNDRRTTERQTLEQTVKDSGVFYAKTISSETGPVTFNYLRMAIVTHDEGGREQRYALD
jgi:hypothetical protein